MSIHTLLLQYGGASCKCIDAKVCAFLLPALFGYCVPCCVPCCSFEFFAGDDVFLGAAAKAYAAEGQDWRRSYYLPTSADLAIMKMRQWLVRQNVATQQCHGHKFCMP